MDNYIYDIVYSITAHENYNILNNLIDNIIKFNKNYNVLICLNLNKYMYENRNSIKQTNVIINHNVFDKRPWTSDFLKAHISNFQFLLNENILFDNFMLLASNCMLIKQIKLPNKNVYDNRLYFTYAKDNQLEKLNDWSNWPNILKNKIIINILIENKVKITRAQHEGRLYNFTLFYNIYKFIKDYNLLNLIEQEGVFEEFLLPSLEHYYNNGKMVPVYCKVFWEKKDYLPNIDDVKKCINDPNIFAVKRVNRYYNDIVRNFINSL